MTSNNRNRRWAAGVGSAFAAALIGLAHAPAATADTDLDPFQDLFGNTGINTWTSSADSFLASIDPTNALAGNLDTSVDDFFASALFGPNFPEGDAPVSFILSQLDPSAFSGDLWDGGLPQTATADLAVGLDYTLFASGLGPAVDPLISNIPEVVLWPEQFLALLFLLFG